MSVETIAETVLKILPPLLTTAVQKFPFRRLPDEKGIEHLGNLLTGRLVYLLRYLDDTGDARYPHSYGRVLSAYVDIGSNRPPASFSSQAEPAWEHASKYACWYLSALGLVKQYGAIGGEIAISDLGKSVIETDEIRTHFRPAFEQSLPS